MEKCEALKGGNSCGRKAEFYIVDEITGNNKFSCEDCPGRIMIENDMDLAKIERLYE